MRTRTIFRNRWFTLLWAAGICWSAAQFATPADDGGNGADDASINAMKDTLATLEKQR